MKIIGSIFAYTLPEKTVSGVGSFRNEPGTCRA